jgi:hypothetical protein
MPLCIYWADLILCGKRTHFDSKEIVSPYIKKPIPVAVRYEAWACGRLLAGIAGSNPAEDMDVLWVLYVVR